MRRSLPILLLLACGRAPAVTAPDVLATVNGVSITAAELDLPGRTGHGGAPDPGDRAATLQNAIRQELAAQRAIELGLDADPRYLEQVRKMEAQVAAYRRQKLSELYEERELSRRAVADDAGARRWFDAHAAELRTSVHVMQILSRDEAAVRTAKAAIDAGEDFEKVASDRFPGLPESAGRPWDLGVLHWAQVPDAWQEPLAALQPGQVSDVIAGPASRFWIVKLVDRSEDPAITFDSERPLIEERMKVGILTELRAADDLALRQKAKIVYAGR